jgi:sugar fermentation stimulation protein A
MQLPQGLVEGNFLHRRNRFAAAVLVDGVLAVAHVPNSGRMAELLTPGAPVRLKPAPAGALRKTAYDLVLVRYQARWVCVDSRMPPALVVEAWRSGLLGELGGYQEVRGEVRFGKSRLDLCFRGEQGVCYVEVKSVNLVEDGLALFPYAPTVRGVRHLMELERALEVGHGAAVVFVVQRDDATALAPYREADPEFGKTLDRVVAQGVGAYAIACSVTEVAITPQKRIPVRVCSRD